MTIFSEPFDKCTLHQMQEHYFGDMVKGVVDIERNLLALDAELHSDLESMLLKDGSLQENLWGINLYPEMEGEDFLEFDSLINIRPRQNNRGRGVEDANIRDRITQLIASLIR